MASTKPAPPNRPLPPPPTAAVPSHHGLAPPLSLSTTMGATILRDSSKLGVPAPVPRSSGRASPQPSPSSSIPPLGPPPSLPLPELPPFPSPITPQVSKARIRSIDAPPVARSSLARRVSEGVLSESSPTSPTASIRSSAESATLTPHVSRRVASSSSLGRRPPRPLSSASVWSVASANSHLSAASEALGQSMAELDREADAMGILLPPPSPRPDSSSTRSHLSRSLGSSSGKRHRSSQRLTLASSQTHPLFLPSPTGSHPPSIPLPSPPLSQPPLRPSSSTPLLASTLRKVSLRSLYPPPLSPGLPSPNEDDESEPSHEQSPANTVAAQQPTQQQRQHQLSRYRIPNGVGTRSTRSSTASSLGGNSTPLPSARFSLASSSTSSGSGSAGSQSFHSAASSGSDGLASHQMATRGRSSQAHKFGSVAAAAAARAAQEGRTSPDVADMLEATPKPIKKISSGNLEAAARASASTGNLRSQSRERARSKSRVRGDSRNEDMNVSVNLKPLRGSTSMPAGLLTTLSEPVPVPPPLPPPSSFSRSRYQLSEIARRATEEVAAMTIVSPTESTGDDAWMTPDSGEGVDSGSETESSIDLHTPLP